MKNNEIIEKIVKNIKLFLVFENFDKTEKQIIRKQIKFKTNVEFKTVKIYNKFLTFNNINITKTSI